MVELAMALDFGSSLTKGIYTTNTNYVKPELILFDPEVIEVPNVSISNYERSKVGNPKPEDSSWICLDEKYYAVGFLAKRRFKTIHCLNSLKIDSALPLTLAMVGAAAQQKKLGNTFSVDLAVVLPYSEYKDRDRLKLVLKTALENFEYRGENFSVTLNNFEALPEGGGLFARGRIASKGKPLQKLTEVNILVLMLGYRNASLLVIERGSLTTGLTSTFGFSMMIDRIKSVTSGQEEETLIPAICSSKELSDKVLNRLARSSQEQLREMEKNEIKEALTDAKAEYITVLSNWVSQQIPSHLELDELIIGGGTSKYFRNEIRELAKTIGGKPNWSTSLEKRIQQGFGNQISDSYLAPRLTDVYGLFYKLLKKPLPTLKKEQKSNSKEVNRVA